MWHVGRFYRAISGLSCVLGWLCVSALGSCAPETPATSGDSRGREAKTGAAKSQTPVILIVIDTLRADHLGSYGYPLETSPILDEFASKATLFENNSTQVNVTHASLTSILTGLYARTHGAYAPVPNAGEDYDSNSHLGLAQLLEAKGYHTLGAVSHPALHLGLDSPTLSGWNELSEIDKAIVGAPRRKLANGKNTNERVFRMLSEYAPLQAEQPLFLWSHYFDPHTDLPGLIYDAPPQTRNLFVRHHLEQVGLERLEEKLIPLTPQQRHDWINRHWKDENYQTLRMANGRALYDAEIRACDFYVGNLFNRLKKQGLYDEAMIIVMADHGENMEAESDLRTKILFTHHRLFQGVTRTPLIIKLPGQTEGQRVSALTQNIDVFPTILEVLDIDAPAQVEGKSLMPLIRGEVDRVHKRIFIESGDRVEKAIKTQELKVIAPGNGDDMLAFDWIKDPLEMENRAEELAPELLEGASTALNAFAPPPSFQVRLEPEERPYWISIKAFTEADELDLADESAVLDDRQLFSWIGQVGSAPVDLEFESPRRRTAIRWKIERSDLPRVDDLITINGQSLWESAAQPLYATIDASAPDAPILTLNRDAAASTYEVQVAVDEPNRIELCLAARIPNKDFALTTLAQTGFEEEQKKRGFSHTFTVEQAKAASLKVNFEPSDVELIPLVTIDGSWPDPKSIALNGQSVAYNVLGFLLPKDTYSPRGSSSNAPDQFGAKQPGRIVIQYLSGSGETEFNTEGMDEEMIEQLRALGYIK